MVFHSSRLAFHGSRSVFMVPGRFFHLNDILRFQVGFHCSRLLFMIFMIPGWFFMVPGRFFQLGLYDISRFQVGFHCSWSVFMIPGWFFMVQGQFSWFFIPSWFIMVPG